MILTEQLALDLKLLSDKSRLTILGLLREKELCACEVAEILNISQPNLSQHMRKLREGGLVHETKKSQWVYYSLAIDNKPHIIDLIKHVPSQKDRIEALSCDQLDCCN
jgi:ArsR family transcriptional regulator, arsenate/arsenite/antimonite-responsive transcriptional repressor